MSLERYGRGALVTALAFILCGAAPPSRLEVQLSGARNHKGVVHFCLTRNTRHFPDCAADPQAIRRTVPAAQASKVEFQAVPPGRYALSVFHDENGNEKLDTFLKMPREGFGFSRNPVIRFGPPRFEQVQFSIGEAMSRQSIRLQYLL